MSVPLTRSLPVVLREALGPSSDHAESLSAGPGITLLVGTCGNAIAAPTGNAYVDVVINGAHVTVPKLNGAKFATGAPAYLLTAGDFMLYLGTVSTTAL